MKLIKEVEIFDKKLNLFEFEGEKFFQASQVGDMIEYSRANISKMVGKVDSEEKRLICVRTDSMNSKARDQKQWFLSRDGLWEVLFQSRKDIAKRFKKEVKRILREIEDDGIYIATEKDDAWFSTRNESKTARRNETDVIEEFVNYAKTQGSSKPNWYYKHFTTLVNKKLDIPQGTTRDDMDKQTLIELMCYETMISIKLKQQLTGDEYYKDIYKSIKEIIEEF